MSARMLGAAESDILLGARSIEAEIVRMSETGRLRDYRVVAFCNAWGACGRGHGLNGTGTFADAACSRLEADDGYLSASEIARLKLDADWVILSACNTAAGEAKGAEALSGLARAFFYAGARALLVSHWYVNSEATVALIKGAFEELNAAPKIGRAEALRRSMLALIDKGPQRFAHPAAWAPFVVVGEGGAGRQVADSRLYRLARLWSYLLFGQCRRGDKLWAFGVGSGRSGIACDAARRVRWKRPGSVIPSKTSMRWRRRCVIS